MVPEAQFFLAKMKTTAYLFALSLVAAALECGAAMGVRGMNESMVTMHDNDLYFNSPDGVTVTFQEGGHAITGGQPYGGTTASGNKLDVRAGRKGSSGPAAAFKDHLAITNMLADMHFLDSAPEDLNFAVFGNMTFAFNGGGSVTCTNIHIGQGHYWTHNNWWIGSTDCTSIPTSNTLKCKCGSAFKTTLQIDATGDSDKFYVSQD